LTVEYKKEFVHQILKWGKSNIRSYPWRDEIRPLNILIVEIFLQKTPADRVAERYSELINAFTLSIEELDPDFLKQKFTDLGLLKKIDWLIETREFLQKNFNGIVPIEEKDLLKLPGVGRYTASAVRCFAYNQSVPLVDINVMRVISRFFGFVSQKGRKGIDEMYKFLAGLVPNNCPKVFNYSLLDFGALICKKEPLCANCPINSICKFFQIKSIE